MPVFDVTITDRIRGGRYGPFTTTGSRPQARSNAAYRFVQEHTGPAMTIQKFWWEEKQLKKKGKPPRYEFIIEKREDALAWVRGNCKFANDTEMMEGMTEEEMMEGMEGVGPAYQMEDLENLWFMVMRMTGGQIRGAKLSPDRTYMIQERDRSEIEVRLDLKTHKATITSAIYGMAESDKEIVVDALAPEISKALLRIIPDHEGQEAMTQLFFGLESPLDDVNGHSFMRNPSSSGLAPGFISRYTNESPVFCTINIYANAVAPGVVSVHIDTIDEYHGPGTPGSKARQDEDLLVDPSVEEVIARVGEMISAAEEQKVQEGQTLFSSLVKMHEEWHRANVLQSKFSGRAEDERAASISKASAIATETGKELSRAIGDWLTVHEHYRDDYGEMMKSTMEIKGILDESLRKLALAESRKGGDDFEGAEDAYQKGVFLDLLQDKMRNAVKGVSLALNVAHKNGIVARSLGVTPEMLDRLSNLDLGEVDWRAEKYLSWVRRHCKFAAGYEQQLLFDFDEPGAFSGDPEEHPGLTEDLEPFAPEWSEEWVTGFYHVTTNLPAVMRSGELKSRSQLGPEAGLGLGGGGDISRAAPDKISLTHNRYKAEEISDGLKLMGKIASGQSSAGEVFWHVCGDTPYFEDYEHEETFGVLAQYIPNIRTPEDGGHEDIAKALDATGMGPEEQYTLLQELDDAIARDEPENSEDVTARVGYTAPWESIKDIDPDKVGIISLQVRKGASYEHVAEEMEMRLDPDDVRIMDVVGSEEDPEGDDEIETSGGMMVSIGPEGEDVGIGRLNTGVGVEGTPLTRIDSLT
jgi:hypothetical protein